MSGAHFGIDIQTIRHHAPVYAIAPGTVFGVSTYHFSIGIPGPTAYYTYWHLRRAAGIVTGAWVARGQLIGWTFPTLHHLHLAEWNAQCGWIDPRRPTGALHTPANRERPWIGPILAYAAYAKAFIPVAINRDPALLHDPNTQLPLAGLRGKVDFRASVLDLPVLRLRYQRQLPLQVAAIRSYIAPATNRHRAIGPIRHIYDGARLFRLTTGVWHVWAFGTHRLNGCYFDPDKPCSANYVWHVGGRSGIDTARIPNGHYQFCVQAITINGIKNHRCAPITIQHR